MAKAEKLPKTPAACADLLYTTREERLQLQKQVDRLKERETVLTEYFVNTLPKSQASGIAGRLARVQIKPKDIPVVRDWDRFYGFVKKNGFQFLQRRVNEGAVKELWENKKQVPGVEHFNVKTVSVTALK